MTKKEYSEMSDRTQSTKSYDEMDSQPVTWREKVEKLYGDLGRKPSLAELLELARTHTMTPEEREAQRRSWVIGNLLLDHPDYSKDYVEGVYDGLEAARKG